MDVFTVLTPLIVIAFLLFLTLRLIIKYCKPTTVVTSSSSSSSADTEAPDFTRVANHLFVSNTPHTCMFHFLSFSVTNNPKRIERKEENENEKKKKIDE
ncbi:hypothetical protein CAEBREN_16425 [Caenorhabditis brenneri]|uniref:Uncharacterized protein n=1 Tax=Caenorhabditis brenneri TaxID=135651 RepID=G0NM52_CAEBE|nr:hypothetical protein CAEBREN_16425 [Caenorhabditis brenneri]